MLHEWHSTIAEDGLTFDLRIELDTNNDGVADSHSNVVAVLIDNTAPDAALDIDLGVGVECADFAPGATFTGHYSPPEHDDRLRTGLSFRPELLEDQSRVRRSSTVRIRADKRGLSRPRV